MCSRSDWQAARALATLLEMRRYGSDRLAQPAMAGLIVEASVPQHHAAHRRRGARQVPELDGIGTAESLGNLTAEDGDHVRLDQDRPGREIGGFQRDVARATLRREGGIDEAEIVAARRDQEMRQRGAPLHVEFTARRRMAPPHPRDAAML